MRELEELAGFYRKRGLSEKTAHQVAVELTAVDPLRAHLDAELGIDPNDLTNPTHAAISSFVAFTIGALLPVAFVLLPPPSLRMPVAFGAVVVALALTGWISARLGHADKRRAVVRIVFGGAVAMALTWAVGSLLGVSGVG